MSSRPKLEAVPGNLPEPPYPSDTAVKGWRFQIDHERLFASDTWALAPPDMRPWLLMIWHMSWVQRPAGAFSNDYDVIAAKIGMDPRLFAAHADILLRGFVLHSDGRLYHPVVVEQVLGLLGVKEAERQRKAEWRRKQAEKRGSPKDVPRDRHGTDMGKTTPEPEPEPEPEPGREEKIPVGAQAPAVNGSLKSQVWDLGERLLGSRSLVGKLVKEHGEAAVLKALIDCDLHEPVDPKGYIHGALRGGKKPAAGSSQQERLFRSGI